MKPRFSRTDPTPKESEVWALSCLLCLVSVLLLPLLPEAEAFEIEKRPASGSAGWVTTNHYRMRVESAAPAATPILTRAEFPLEFSPDSLRVVDAVSARVLPAKLEWRPPMARIAWRSTGTRTYFIYFDLGHEGETKRLVEPAMVGAGDRVSYGRAGVRAKLGVGLWPHPVALDFDRDGNTDVIVGCPDVGYSGTYLFRNIGTNAKPLFDRALWIGPATRDLVAADFDGDGAVDFVVSGGYYSDVRRNGLTHFVPVKLPRDYHVGSDDLWYPVDWDGDGKLDVLCGNDSGYIQYFENVGTTREPAFADRGYLKAAGEAIRITAGPNGSIQGPMEAKWGYTNPTVADWDLDGKPDLIVNSIWGKVVWYRNVGTRTKPELAAAQPIEVEWQGPPPKPAWTWWNPKGKELVTQWRTTPCVVDWNRDGLPDLVMLDREGYLAFYERYREAGQLKLKPPARIFLDANGNPLRLNAERAGKSGRRKIQIVDWDGDGKLDLIVDSEANAGWYQNVGSQGHFFT